MAVIQYTGIVNQIRGKLNGSQFNKSRTIATLTRKSQQSKAVKGSQSQPRSDFAVVQREWKNVSASEKQQWQLQANSNPVRNRFGDLVTLSGYNMFIKANVNRVLVGEPVTLNAYPNPAPSAPFVISPSGRSLAFDGIWIDVGVTVSGFTPDEDFYFQAYVSLPLSDGVTTYYDRWTFAGSTAHDTGPIEMGKRAPARYPRPSNGQPAIVAIEVLHVPSGIVVNSQEFNINYTVT